MPTHTHTQIHLKIKKKNFESNKSSLKLVLRATESDDKEELPPMRRTFECCLLPLDSGRLV